MARKVKDQEFVPFSIGVKRLDLFGNFVRRPVGEESSLAVSNVWICKNSSQCLRIGHRRPQLS
jgi:hypothetical protein